MVVWGGQGCSASTFPLLCTVLGICPETHAAVAYSKLCRVILTCSIHQSKHPALQCIFIKQTKWIEPRTENQVLLWISSPFVRFRNVSSPVYYLSIKRMSELNIPVANFSCFLSLWLASSCVYCSEKFFHYFLLFVVIFPGVGLFVCLFVLWRKNKPLYWCVL